MKETFLVQLAWKTRKTTHMHLGLICSNYQDINAWEAFDLFPNFLTVWRHVLQGKSWRGAVRNCCLAIHFSSGFSGHSSISSLLFPGKELWALWQEWNVGSLWCEETYRVERISSVLWRRLIKGANCLLVFTGVNKQTNKQWLIYRCTWCHFCVQIIGIQNSARVKTPSGIRWNQLKLHVLQYLGIVLSKAIWKVSQASSTHRTTRLWGGKARAYCRERISQKKIQTGARCDVCWNVYWPDCDTHECEAENSETKMMSSEVCGIHKQV